MGNEEEKLLPQKTKVLRGILGVLILLAGYYTITNIFFDDDVIEEQPNQTQPLTGAYCVKEILCGEHLILDVSEDECVMMYESDLLDNNCSYVVVE